MSKLLISADSENDRAKRKHSGVIGEKLAP
jgi:hypothetical protein